MTKEKLTIPLSLVALLVSVLSATISYQLQKSDSQRSARTQLNNSINELINLNARNNALWNVPEEARDIGFYQQLSTNSQTAASFTRQAVYLAEKNPELVTDIEFSNIAMGLVIVGDTTLAETYWQKAVDASPSDFYAVVNLRGYADFLFREGNHEKARDSYRKALKVFNNDTDKNKATNGYTYQMWMASERTAGFLEESMQHYERAKNLYESISFTLMREHNLGGLSRAWGE